MHAVTRLSLCCAVVVGLTIIGCSSGSSTGTTTNVPTNIAEKQKAAQGEVDKSKEVMQKAMEKGGYSFPTDAKMPEFKLPAPPPGVKPTGPAPSPPGGAPPSNK